MVRAGPLTVRHARDPCVRVRGVVAPLARLQRRSQLLVLHRVLGTLQGALHASELLRAPSLGRATLSGDLQVLQLGCDTGGRGDV